MIPDGAVPEQPDPFFWSDGPARSRTRRRRSPTRSVGRLRTAAALVLVAALAAAWLLTAHRRAPGALAAGIDRVAPRSTVAGSPVPTSTPSNGRLLLDLLPTDARCADTERAADRTRCSIAGVDVEYRLAATGALQSAYLAAVLPGYAGGASALAAGSGPPACARGAEDERAWSRPAAPASVAGRYACRIEQGRAAMWWTVDSRGLLAHASAADGDLASLFEWWESHSER